MTVTENFLDYNWKEIKEKGGSSWLLLILHLLPAVFNVLVNRVAQKGTDLGHDSTATTSSP